MRLYRPHVPLSVRCEVAARQIAQRMAPNQGFVSLEKPLGARLARLLLFLSELLGCTVKDLRLDHDPPLAARPRYRRGLGRKTYYQPPANDPDHLFYRPHGPQFEGSHLIKTNVRGDHGQFPDRVLIKRERRRLAKKRPPKRSKKSTPKYSKKYSWPSRPLRSGSRWPKKGGRDAGAHGNSDR